VSHCFFLSLSLSDNLEQWSCLPMLKCPSKRLSVMPGMHTNDTLSSSLFPSHTLSLPALTPCIHPCLRKNTVSPIPLTMFLPPQNLPLLMLWILAANDINITALLPPHTLAPVTQLLDRTANFHAARLYPHAAAPILESG